MQTEKSRLAPVPYWELQERYRLLWTGAQWSFVLQRGSRVSGSCSPSLSTEQNYRVVKGCSEEG